MITISCDQHRLWSTQVGIKTSWDRHKLWSTQVGTNTSWDQHKLWPTQVGFTSPRTTNIWDQLHVVIIMVGIHSPWGWQHVYPHWPCGWGTQLNGSNNSRVGPNNAWNEKTVAQHNPGCQQHFGSPTIGTHHNPGYQQHFGSPLLDAWATFRNPQHWDQQHLEPTISNSFKLHLKASAKERNKHE